MAGTNRLGWTCRHTGFPILTAAQSSPRNLVLQDAATAYVAGAPVCCSYSWGVASEDAPHSPQGAAQQEPNACLVHDATEGATLAPLVGRFAGGTATGIDTRLPPAARLQRRRSESRHSPGTGFAAAPGLFAILL